MENRDDNIDSNKNNKTNSENSDNNNDINDDRNYKDINKNNANNMENQIDKDDINKEELNIRNNENNEDVDDDNNNNEIRKKIEHQESSKIKNNFPDSNINSNDYSNKQTNLVIRNNPSTKFPIKADNNKCFSIDNISISICNYTTLILKYICIPSKFILKYPLSHFERPYSLIMIVNYFLLISPFILLTVGLLQQSKLIFSNTKFSFVYLFLYITIIMNYYFTFAIYAKYGIHKLHQKQKEFNVSSFLKYLFYYLFKEHKIGYVIVYMVIQLIPKFFIIDYLNNFVTDDNDNEYNSSSKDLVNMSFEDRVVKLTPVLLFFTRYSLYSDMSFILIHLFIYLLLVLVILCKINGSCLCLIMVNWLCCIDCCYDDTMDILREDKEKGFGDKKESTNRRNKSNQHSNDVNEDNFNNKSDLNKSIHLDNQPYDVIECSSNNNRNENHNSKNQNQQINNINIQESPKLKSKKISKGKTNSIISLDSANNNFDNKISSRKMVKYRVSKTKGVYLTQENNIIRTLPFVESLLEFFKYIKLFDFDKELGDGEKILKDI